MTNQVSRMDRR